MLSLNNFKKILCDCILFINEMFFFFLKVGIVTLNTSSPILFPSVMIAGYGGNTRRKERKRFVLLEFVGIK